VSHTVAGPRPGVPGLRHDLAFAASPRAFAAVAAPFLAEGVAGGDAAVVVADPASLLAVHDLAGPGSGILLLTRDSLYGQRSVAALTAVRRLVRAQAVHGGHRVRMVTQPDPGREPRRWREWQRYEAVLEHVLVDIPLWQLCVYDDALPDAVLATAPRTHRHVVDGGRRRPSPSFTEPVAYLAGLPPLPEPAQDGVPVLDLAAVTELQEARRAVLGSLTRAGRSGPAAEDLVMAVTEVVTNGLLHGRPPVRLQLWLDGDRAVAAVSDRGPGPADPFAGYRPAHGEDAVRGGMGLWLARQLCDHVDVFAGADGTTVRLATVVG
jgi:anti-sigma regulatory factor (Ser/Thr protein kinase)